MVLQLVIAFVLASLLNIQNFKGEAGLQDSAYDSLGYAGLCVDSALENRYFLIRSLAC